MNFKLHSKFKPTGDQPLAIEKLSNGLQENKENQVLLGVTGSGKTFTIANVIQKYNKPTLIISHNKTLAAQVYQEMRDFFPENAVSYFVSYYDFYQPEAYIPTTDTYIAKETEVNDEIDKLRLAATTNILTRPDTIVVASVSCIYNLGSPQEYSKYIFTLKKGEEYERQHILERLLDLMYERNDYNFTRGTFRVRGEVIELHPAYDDYVVRIVLKGKTIERLEILDPLTSEMRGVKEEISIYPAKHYITDPAYYKDVFAQIRRDLKERTDELKKQGKDLEAHRINQRTEYDLKMLTQLGYVNGIENYSRYFDGRKPGDAPFSLIEYFEKSDPDWLLIVDESHMTIPQIRGMYNGDRARKQMLVDFGFRLPSAFDNRPLTFEEFRSKVHKTIYMSATPSLWEIEKSGANNIAEQLIRPTGVVDPEVTIKKTDGQILDLLSEIKMAIENKGRVLVTTLTKRMAEELSSYLEEEGIAVTYLHADIQTLERQDVLDDLREGKYDVLVGINLLREGLDLPEVSLVAILDADKEGFLRSRSSLIQIMGRAARKVDSRVILYADIMTDSIKAAVAEVKRRRKIQLEYNKKNNITAKSVEKSIREKLIKKEEILDDVKPLMDREMLLPDQKKKVIKKLRDEMKDAVKNLDFETAALLRDKIKYIEQQ
ncbi:MAG: excinuclease ABC subunit UvrB [Candidatus Levybacteria bacterium]|nr:excinuclease ABC subunit UvrB [Candidatus Levybacteria bacterium]MBP9815509.1 excinuclease ABC subunit UvrB [Candidatus Levybacteria bacterium]